MLVYIKEYRIYIIYIVVFIEVILKVVKDIMEVEGIVFYYVKSYF